MEEHTEFIKGFNRMKSIQEIIDEAEDFELEETNIENNDGGLFVIPQKILSLKSWEILIRK